MQRVQQYLLTVTAAAIICAFVRSITHNKGSSAAIIKIISAVFLSVTVISPWSNWSVSEFTEYIQESSIEADTIVAEGVAAAQKETETIIKSQSEAYIEDKAMSLGVTLQADVTVTDSQLHTVTITIEHISPYHKQQIIRYIAADLGIAEAAQIWN